MRSAPARGARDRRSGQSALGLHRAPLRVDQHFAKAVGAVQFLFAGAFHAQLADQRGAGIGRTVDARQVGLADGRDIAQRMYRQLTMRIVARQARADVHAREVVAVHRKARDFLFAEAQADRHGLEAAPCPHQPGDVAHLVVGDQLQLRQAAQGSGEVGNLLAHQLQLIRGLVFGQHLAVAIEDEAPVGGNGLQSCAVAL